MTNKQTDLNFNKIFGIIYIETMKGEKLMDATKIFDTLRQRYNDANDKYPGQVIAIATFGSQNYGISHEDSDIDTKTI